jgi:hypothetical protein
MVLQSVASRTGALRGVVYGPEGRPLAGVHLAFGPHTERTTSSGEFFFEYDSDEPPADLLAVARGLLPERLDRESMVASSWPETVEIHLTEEPLSLSGLVLDRSGKPLSDVEVWLQESTVLSGPGDDFWVAELVISGDSSLQISTQTDERGRFQLVDLCDREYELRAMDPRLAWQIVAGNFRAGDQNVVIQFSEGLHAQLEGQVVDRNGDPVPGVKVRVITQMLAGKVPDGRLYYNTRSGAASESDEAGFFELSEVPSQESCLEFSGAGIMNGQTLEIPATLTDDLLEMQVAFLCQLRVDQPSGGGEADSFVLLNQRGESLEMCRREVGRTTLLRQAPLREGKSELLAVPDTAETLVLKRGDQEVRRLPVALQAGEINVVR